jgi:hypothetical protein
MQNVISLREYRKRLRKVFLTKHKVRLDRFIARFIDHHLDMDLLRDTYAAQTADGSHLEASWDYSEFRDILAETLDRTVGQDLYRQLKSEKWFDHRLVTRDEVIERCLSDYILTRFSYAMHT